MTATVTPIAQNKVDLKPRIHALVDDLSPLVKQERAAEHQFQISVSPLLFAQAARLVQEPEENIDEVFAKAAQFLNKSKATLVTRREVGLRWPQPHPAVPFSVYVELLKALDKDRDEIFAQKPAEEWTADTMKIAIRKFYLLAMPTPRHIQKKEVTLKGIGKITISTDGKSLEIDVPHALDFETTAKGHHSTMLTALLSFDQEDVDVEVV
jgi:hypothetical protein